MFAGLIDIAIAGESLSFSVSCTIPAIPGVNAPPFNENIQNSELNKPAEEQLVSSEKKEMKKDESNTSNEEEVLLAEAKTPAKIMQTFYSR